MRNKYRIAFVLGGLFGLTGVIALSTGGDARFVFLSICASTILTTLAPPKDDDPEALNEHWHFVVFVLLACMAVAIGAVFAKGPLFLIGGGETASGSAQVVPFWLRVAFSVGWVAIMIHRTDKRWRTPAAV